MAGNIKGIIVEIGGDTSKLQKALKDVNSKTASLSKELRGINSLLKLDPKNTELVGQKQTVLKQNIEKTTEKLNDLKEAQARYVATGKDLNTPEYRNLQREIILTENQLKQLKKEASNWTQASQKLSELSSKMKKIGDSISSIGKKLTTTLTVPIVSLGTIATKGAIEFESAFAGVKKTVDETANTSFADLNKGIRELSKEIPSTTTEISAVAEAAGQLGIGADNVLDFTKTMINMGNATNLSADEAATTLARFANVTKMSKSDFDKLGSVIVALGNNFATTEAEIAAMGMNLASAGTQVGMSQSQIMALATALSSVGLEAQAGGTAFSKVMVNMQLAVEKGGKELKNFASVAGMSTKEFQRAFKEDATSAIMQFVDGLSKSGERGKSAIKILDDMGITETRLRDALLRSANASEVMKDAIELGNKAWEENTALTDEANKRYETTQSKMIMLKNKLQDIGVTIGNIIMPYIQKFVDKIGELTKKFENLSPHTQEMIVKIGLIAAAIGPVLLIVGKLISSIGSIFGLMSSISGAIGSAMAGIGGLSSVLTALTGPIGIVIAVIGVLTAVFVHLYQTNEEFRNKVQETWQNIVNVFQNSIMPVINQIKDLISNVLQTIWGVIQEIWSVIEPFIKEAFEAIMDWWNESGQDIVGTLMWLLGKLFEGYNYIYQNIIQPVIQVLTQVLKPVVGAVFGAIVGVIKGVLDTVTAVWNGIKGEFNGIVDFITGVFTGDWEKAWEGVKQIFSSIVNTFGAIFKAPINFIIDTVNGFIKGMNKITIPDWVPGIGGAGINIPLIPKLAKGGIVDKATLAMIGEGKSPEAVIPLDGTLTKYLAEALKKVHGNQSIQVNFYPQSMTEAEMDRAFNYIDRKYGILY